MAVQNLLSTNYKKSQIASYSTIISCLNGCEKNLESYVNFSNYFNTSMVSYLGYIHGCFKINKSYCQISSLYFVTYATPYSTIRFKWV